MQESQGNLDAHGASGEYGLMQIVSNENPRFPGRPSPSQLLDPNFNVKYGTNMLAGLIEKHGLWQGVRCYNSCSRPMEYYADKVKRIYNDHR